MEVSVFLSFIAATTVMIASPGPSVLITVANSLSAGWRKGLRTVAGATAGIAVQLLIVVIGITTLLNVFVEVFICIRWAGVTYLIYLGVRQIISAGTDKNAKTIKGKRSGFFVQGLVTTIPNPKSLIFMAAFLPQCIDPSKPLTVQLLIIIPTFLAITFSVTSVWALAAGPLGRLLRNPAAERWGQRITGGLLIAAAIGLALARVSSQSS